MKKILTILSVSLLLGNLAVARHTVAAPRTPTQPDECATTNALLKDEIRLNCYPNPFRGETNISYHVGTETKVTIKIYNAIAQEVRTIVNEVQPEGDYQIDWNGEANSGYRAPQGTYFLRAQIGNQFVTKQILMLK